MSIKTFLGLTVGGMLCLSCQSNVYQIHGFAHDFMDGDTICLRFESDEDRLVTITQVADGKFTFSGETDAVSLCHIYPKSKPENVVKKLLTEMRKYLMQMATEFSQAYEIEQLFNEYVNMLVRKRSLDKLKEGYVWD